MAKKNILNIAILISFPFVCLSQSNRDSIFSKKDKHTSIKRTLISGSFSPAIPSGNFANKSAINNSGYAKFGSGTQLYIGHDLNKRLGICAMGYFSSFPLDNNSLQSTFQQALGSGYQISVSSIGWRISSYMIGAYDIYSMKSNSKGTLSLFDRALIGFANVYSPEMVLNGTSGTSFIKTEQFSQNTSSFCSLIGLGARITTLNNFTMSYSVDWFFTKPTFKNVPINQNTNGTITNFSTTVNQTISAFPFSISFGWAF